MTKLLLDGDLFAYRCAASAGTDTVERAQYYVESLLDTCINDLQADNFQFYLTGDTNFRFQVYPEYKANRLDVPKPAHLPALREFLTTRYNAIMSDNCEADDCMAIAQTEQTREEPTIIVTLDKDLLQVPGEHYSWHIEGGPRDKRWVREARRQTVDHIQGLRFFYTQMLTGDVSDNIKGVDGIGKVGAKNLLSYEHLTEEEMFSIVRDQYSCDAEMLMNGQCLWMQRHKGEMWQLLYTTDEE